MDFHEAANIFPMDEGNISALADDMGFCGQQVPIELCEGKIIDGRRRFKACALAGLEPKFRDVNPLDPVAYVLSLNLHRRHLTPSQLAMVGARAGEVAEQLRERAKERQRRKPKSVVANLPQQISDTGKTRDQIGKLVGVSGKSIDYATKVLNEAVPEVVKAVDEGRMAISTAAILASEPEEKQRGEASKPKRERTRHPKPAVEKEDPENIRTAYFLRADAAIQFAKLGYSGPVAQDIVDAARRVASSWDALVKVLEVAL